MAQVGEPDIDRFYGNLRNYAKMVTGGYSNLLMLDAKGGLGKSYQITSVLSEELERDEWVHQKGFTTPIELFKTLWMARDEGTVLFLDDMSGVTNNQKAVDMLKAATETNGAENWIEYRTSQDIDHPYTDGAVLPNTFCFRGRLILSFNETPDNHHFNALKDRGTYYQMSFTYQERLEIINELAKKSSFSELSVREQKEIATWISEVTDSSFDVTIRTFEEICQMKHFADETGENWRKMAYEIFDMDWKKHRIIQLRENSDKEIEEQIDIWTNETEMSRSHYYDLLSEIRDDRM